VELGLKFANQLSVRSAMTWLRSTLPVTAASRIAVQISPELWESTRRKLGKNSAGKNALRDYVQTRAAQLAQLKVDEMVRSKSSLSGRSANKLILKAANAATKMTLEKAAHYLN
jgi:hypothetical protein